MSNDQYQIQFWILNSKCSYSNGIEITNIYYIAMVSKMIYFKELIHAFLRLSGLFISEKWGKKMNEKMYAFLNFVIVFVSIP